MPDEQTRLQSVRTFTAAADLKASWSLPGIDLKLEAGSGAADDCAIVSLDGSGTLVLGSDYVRGVGFTLFTHGLLSYYDLGWYLATANISDIAAMGAAPVALLTVIRYPKSMTEDEFADVLAGISDVCRAHGANPMGGDIGGAERLFLSASAVGVCATGAALQRDGARPGHLLAVTGPVGTPAAALVYFDRLRARGHELGAELEEQLLSSWRRPQARVAEGRLLAQIGVAACQDISDGLRDTVQQLCRASGVGCRVDAEALPIEESVTAVAALADLDPVALALGASVDFELAFALDPQDEPRCRESFSQAGFPLHVIGEFTAGHDITIDTPAGMTAIPGASWNHLTDDPASALFRAARRR